MPCNTRPTNCMPCGDCPPTPDPILPRCDDVELADGVYTNATVVVENGCIIEVQQGTPFVYQAQACCGGSGGGGGSEGLDGAQGPPGQSATVTVGTVTTLPAGSQATVTNVGTTTNAVLNFALPAGAPGSAAVGVSGVTQNSAGWRFENGLVKELPFLWPPVVQITGSSDYPLVNIAPTKDADGVVTLSLTGLSTMVTMLETTMDSKDNAVRSSLQTAIDDLQDQIDALKNCLSTSHSITCP